MHWNNRASCFTGWKPWVELARRTAVAVYTRHVLTLPGEFVTLRGNFFCILSLSSNSSLRALAHKWSYNFTTVLQDFWWAVYIFLCVGECRKLVTQMVIFCLIFRLCLCARRHLQWWFMQMSAWSCHKLASHDFNLWPLIQWPRCYLSNAVGLLRHGVDVTQWAEVDHWLLCGTSAVFCLGCFKGYRALLAPLRTLLQAVNLPCTTLERYHYSHVVWAIPQQESATWQKVHSHSSVCTGAWRSLFFHAH